MTREGGGGWSTLKVSEKVSCSRVTTISLLLVVEGNFSSVKYEDVRRVGHVPRVTELDPYVVFKYLDPLPTTCVHALDRRHVGFAFQVRTSFSDDPSHPVPPHPGIREV